MTDCSGLETPSIALRMLGLDHTLLAASDKKESLRSGIVVNFAPLEIHSAVSVDAGPVPGSVDLYDAGPPCQDFSMAGGRAGEDGQRGGLFEICVERIVHLRPKTFVFENVVGILSISGGAFLRRMIAKLTLDGGYRVSHRVLNIAEHGIPHHRRRVYIVGILGTLSDDDFGWPAVVGHVSLDQLLDRGDGQPSATPVSALSWSLS